MSFKLPAAVVLVVPPPQRASAPEQAEFPVPEVTAELRKKAEITRRRRTFLIVQAAQATQALMCMLLSSGIGLFLLETRAGKHELEREFKLCVGLLACAACCNVLALGLQAVFCLCSIMISTSTPQLRLNHESSPPSTSRSTCKVLQFVPMFFRIHASGTSTAHANTLPLSRQSQILPAPVNQSQSPPSTCTGTVPVPRSGKIAFPFLRRIDPYIRFVAFGYFVAQLAGLVLLGAALMYSESRHIFHEAFVVGSWSMLAMVLIQTVCLLLAYLSSRSK